ncbi:MAG: saccharopine dehydrogenase NADP-binding domain-containing protein [Candidatus Doudnabacteria bacterium]|nr:saccharopine dehydrogenase NADP-binding domain-containing protein [Candidatus Doudnabacteria bacterium]
MQYDFGVIGANGIQGKIVARDLLESGHSVLLCANDDYGLDQILEYKKSDFALIDLKKVDRVKRVIKKSGALVVINCAIDDYNLLVTNLCLDLGVNYVDLGSEEEMTLEQFKLGKFFKEKKLTAITGAGSTPGINNVMLRYARPQFETIHTVHLGFTWTSNLPTFVTPFSLDAVVFEFTEKAKIFENEKFVERRPEECKLNYYYKGIGRQKTYYTKHIEHRTFYEYLKDAGIKNIMVCASFPEHSRRVIETLIDLGLTKSGQEHEILETGMDHLDFTEEALRHLPVPDGYAEKENLWLKIYGKKNGKNKFVEMDAVAASLPGWEDATCNVDTGMPASILAQMIKNGVIAEFGMFSPEFVVPPKPFFSELGKRKIWVYENGKKINGNGSLSLLTVEREKEALAKI